MCVQAARSSASEPSPTAIFRSSANNLFGQRRYRESAGANRRGYEAALRQGDTKEAGRFLSNLAGCSFALFNFREALGYYLSARELAIAAGDTDASTAISLNISSLHFQMGDLDGAAEEGRRAIELHRNSGNTTLAASLLYQLGKIKTRTDGIIAAQRLLSDAIAAAELSGQPAVVAQILNFSGYELLRAGRLREADDAMSRAFRIRRLSVPNDLENSFRTLALLKARQRDFAAALSFADRAVKAAALHPNWTAYYCRAEVLAAAGRTTEALVDFRSAIALARRLRLEVAPSDAHRTGTDVQLRDLYSAFVQVAAAEAIRTRSSALAAESLRVAEEARASSLRALMIGSGHVAAAQPEYGEVLAELRSAEVKLLAGGDASAVAEARRLRYRLTEIEVNAGLSSAPPEASGDKQIDLELRRRLKPGQAFIGFHLADPDSYVWAVTSRGIEIHRAPARRELVALLGEFTKTVARHPSAASRASRAAFKALFGSLSKGVQARREWILALEDALFEAPLAAAETPGGARLVEAHSIRTVPSAHFLLRPVPASPSRTFIGVADPIYNRADPRATGYLKGNPALELPRLVSSASEIRACATAWGASTPLLLEGSNARRETLTASMSGRPAVLHFATHMAPPDRRGARGGIVLTMLPDGSLDVLTASDIAVSSGTAGLVVLSGCGSAGRELEPGAGVTGLTRAWIAAGARSVIATLWPTADSGSAFFRLFYERLGAGDSPGEALRNTQTTCVRTSLPCARDWAAYVAVGD